MKSFTFLIVLSAVLFSACSKAVNAPDAIVAQDHLPAALRGRTYYHPVPRGFEQDIRGRLERWRTELRRRKTEEAP